MASGWIMHQGGGVAQFGQEARNAWMNYWFDGSTAMMTPLLLNCLPSAPITRTCSGTVSP